MSEKDKLDKAAEAATKRIMEGAESTGPAPTPYLQQIVDLMRKPPAKPVTSYPLFKKMFTAKLHRNQYAHSKYAVGSWLKNNLEDERMIDHTMDIILETGDVMIMTQPYHHPGEEDVKKVEANGGYVFCPDPGWGFLHIYCQPNVYLIPVSAVSKFERQP